MNGSGTISLLSTKHSFFKFHILSAKLCTGGVLTAACLNLMILFQETTHLQGTHTQSLRFSEAKPLRQETYEITWDSRNRKNGVKRKQANSETNGFVHDKKSALVFFHIKLDFSLVLSRPLSPATGLIRISLLVP